MKLLITILAVLALVVAGCSMSEVPKTNEGKNGQGRNGGGLELHEEDNLADLPFEDISDSEIEALNMALDDEFKAKATYAQVIEEFGEIKPFSNIINAEQTHIDELNKLYEKYDLQIPEDKWTGYIPDIDSVLVACEIGVQAEIDNAALYDGLFSQVDNEDITAVFTSLRDASQNNHLPAFERCVERES